MSPYYAAGKTAIMSVYQSVHNGPTMIDHFRFLAPLYDRLIKPLDAGRLQEVLRLPADGAM